MQICFWQKKPRKFKWFRAENWRAKQNRKRKVSTWTKNLSNSNLNLRGLRKWKEVRRHMGKRVICGHCRNVWFWVKLPQGVIAVVNFFYFDVFFISWDNKQLIRQTTIKRLSDVLTLQWKLSEQMIFSPLIRSIFFDKRYIVNDQNWRSIIALLAEY